MTRDEMKRRAVDAVVLTLAVAIFLVTLYASM